MTTFDFTPYLPMYGKDAHPQRPWWRLVDQGPILWIRCDGKRGPAIGGQVFYSNCWTMDSTRLTPATEILAAIDAIDEAHPRPRPDPLPGQVWAFDGNVVQILTVDPHGNVYAMHERPVEQRDWSGARHRIGMEVGVLPLAWPIRADVHEAVLVLGPTPWGRDVPWQDTSKRETP